MNLDNLKSSARLVKAPLTSQAPSPSASGHLDDLIEELKKADAVEAKTNRHRMVFFSVVSVLFAMAFWATWQLAAGTMANWSTTLTGLLAAWYLGLGALAGYAMRKNARVDYSKPLVIFLAQAEKRFRLLDVQGLVAALLMLPIAALCIVAGGRYVSDAFHRHLPSLSSTYVYWGYYLFIAATFIFGSVATYKNWKRERAPHWRDIKAQLAKLQSEETES